MGQKRGPQRRNNKNEKRSGKNTYKGQQEWCKLPRRARRDGLNWYRHVIRRDENKLRSVEYKPGKKKDTTTENKMERHVITRHEKYWTESGRGDGRSDMG